MRRVVVTGANRGLGLEFTRQLLASGDEVMATARHPQQAGELAAVVAGSGGRGLAIALDVAGRSTVVNLSSGLGSIAGTRYRGNLAYAVSKAALNMLSRQLGAELRRQGTTVVSMSPGWVSTDMGGPSAPLSPPESVKSM